MDKRTFLKLSGTLLSAVFAQQSFAISNADAAKDLLTRVENHSTITVGTEGTYPPFTYHDASGKLTGYDVEVTRAIAEKLGLKVKFVETKWDAMLAGLNDHRFDFVANQVGLTTAARRAKYDITTRYSYSGEVAVVHKGDGRVKTWEDIKGLRAAQSYTSNYGEKARALGAKIVGVDGLAQSIQLVLQKRADLTLNDRLAVLDFMKKHPDAPLKIALRVPAEEMIGSGIIANKGNEKVIGEFSQAIDALKANGTLKKLSEQFFGEDISVRE